MPALQTKPSRAKLFTPDLLFVAAFQAIDAAAEAERLASKEYKEEMAALAKEKARQARLMGSDKEPTRALTPNVLR